MGLVMKYILALIALTLVPNNVAAQQPETDECSFANIVFNTAKVSRCLQKEREAEAKRKEEAAANLAEAKKVADELKKATENWNNLHSTNPDQQITGVTDTAKDVNSHVNNNPVSEVVTDKAVSLIDQFAHRKKELLDKTSKTVQLGLQPQEGSPSSSFNAGESHQLVEPQGLTLQQQFENRKQVLLSTPSIKPVRPEAESTRSVLGSQQSDLEVQFQSQKDKLLKSASTVSAVSQAYQAIQAAEKAWRDLEAQNELADKIKRDKAAKDAQIAQALKDKQQQIDDDRWWARERRRQQQAWNALFGPPAQAASPYYPSQNGLYSSYPVQYFPSALPQDSSVDPYIVGLPKGSGTVGGGYTHPEIAPCLSIVNATAEISCIMHAPDVDSTGQIVPPVAQQPQSQNGNVPSPAAQSSPPQTPPATAPPTTAK